MYWGLFRVIPCKIAMRKYEIFLVIILKKKLDSYTNFFVIVVFFGWRLVIFLCTPPGRRPLTAHRTNIRVLTLLARCVPIFVCFIQKYTRTEG